MAKKKQDADNGAGGALGQDPFSDLDLGWMEREEGEESVEVLGDDPFSEVDMAGVPERDRRDELFTGGVGQEAAMALDKIEPSEVEEVAEPAAETASLEPKGKETPEAPAVEPTEVIETLMHPDALQTLLTGRPPVAASAEKPTPQATFYFPADFKWGVATAAHQVEGNNTNNDWWVWEQEQGRIKEGHRSGLACNWWQDVETDFNSAVEMGLNALRLSVEWSRIEPSPGEFDEHALERYAHMLKGLRERNIEPMVTLHHFTNPLWLVERGGWENPEVVALFARFVQRVVEALGQYCSLWCTINEPNVYAFEGYIEGLFPPGLSDAGVALSVLRHMLMAHAAAYHEIHTIQPQARVGLAHNMRILDPANADSFLDRRTAQILDRIYNESILTALTRGRWPLPLGIGLARKLRGTLDWIGLNYYTRDLVTFDRSQRDAFFHQRFHATDAELLDGGYGEFYPQGFFRCIQRLARLGIPIYVTENGIPDDDDDQRPRYLLTHLHQMWRAIQLCYPVMGYYHWTLVDNFEWAEGWTLRFGLISLNPNEQYRKPRRSAYLYTDIVRANAINPKIIGTYAPQLRAELLPDCRVHG